MPRLLVLLAALTATGCHPATAAAPLLAPQDQNHAFAVPNEDGSQYVVVEAGGRTPEATVARRWKRTAEHACKGEFIILSQGSAVRRARGQLATRMHEGWVRCLNPEAGGDVKPEDATG